MKRFKMEHLHLKSEPEYFTELNPPKWLSVGGFKYSTIDNSWFYEQQVLTLQVGAEVRTDFRKITRIQDVDMLTMKYIGTDPLVKCLGETTALVQKTEVEGTIKAQFDDFEATRGETRLAYGWHLFSLKDFIPI